MRTTVVATMPARRLAFVAGVGTFVGVISSPVTPILPLPVLIPPPLFAALRLIPTLPAPLAALSGCTPVPPVYFTPPCTSHQAAHALRRHSLLCTRPPLLSFLLLSLHPDLSGRECLCT